MLFLGDIFLALLIGLLFTALFAAAFQNHRTWDALLVFFLVIFLFSWASGVWVTPFGPVLYDLYIFPYFFGALLIAILMAAWFVAMPPQTPATDEVLEKPEEHPEATILIAMGSLFWIFVVVMAVVILVNYL